MNEFDKSIHQAKKKHIASSLWLGGIVAPAAIVLTLWLLFAKGYSVSVAPQEAGLSATFSVAEGFGLFYEDKLYTMGGDVAFTTTAKGYISHTESLNKDSSPLVHVELQPKPGRVVASTIPKVDEVAWYLDGKLVVVGEALKTEVQPGQHQIKLDSPYHQPMTEDFDIGKDEEKVWAFELQPINGFIDINSKPQGASVVLNGVGIGNTPIKVARPGGKYQVRVSKAGYEDTEESFTLTNTSTQANRDYQLAAKKGFVTFMLEPTGGKLLVDGKQITDTGRVALTANQQHAVLYQRAGYYSYQKNITVQPGSENSLPVSLKREMGKVVLSAEPAAQVIVDGKFLGLSPIRTTLSAMTHKVQFKKKGYRTIEKQIKPSGKSPTALNVTLLTEYDARRKEGKPTKAATMGIQMAKFKPTKVTIGSKVSEKGRRRNEFLRQVTFTRPVAVSRHEISEAQYAQFTSKGAKSSSKSNLPVSNISWSEAAQFCNWLSKEDGLPPFYNFAGGRYQNSNASSKGYRLPTEAEWEWLARRAKRSVGTKYVWGNSDRLPKKVANFSDESNRATKDVVFVLKGYQDGHAGKAPVGSFKADRVGLFDLAGNVSEWVHDTYTNVPPDTSKVLRDPMGNNRGTGHLFKGSNYSSGRLKELRNAYRQTVDDKEPTIGFRIARYF